MFRGGNVSSDFDVAVIGYGPTGLVAASALGAKGHRVLVIERQPGLYGLPRLTHIDGETARIIRDVADIDKALKVAKPVDSYKWMGADGEDLLTVDWSGVSSGYAAHWVIFQPDIEDAIDERVRSYPNVTVMQGWNLDHISQDANEVTLQVRKWSRQDNESWAEEGEAKSFTARYVFAADGSNSFVRESLGIQRDDLNSNDVWLNLDCEILRPLPERFAQSSQFCDPVRPNMFMPIGFGRERFELAVIPGDDVDEMKTPEYAWRWFNERHGLGPDDVKILRQIIYTFSARTAETWRAGRVLLGGDAVHSMPPYMGQGACSGMRDGINVAWKLDLVLSGKADDFLLDAYEIERRPHARQIQEVSVFLGQLANTLDALVAAERDTAFRSGNVPPPPPFPTITGGVISTQVDGTASPMAGELAPHGRVNYQGREGLFDAVVGSGFSLITRRPAESLLDQEQLEFLNSINATLATIDKSDPNGLTELDGTYEEFFTSHGADALISRPDFNLFGVASEAALPSLVNELRDKLAIT